MSAAPRVTVIIPHYNGSQFLRETIRSVESQTFPDWEIVIIDDGSSREHLSHLDSLENPRIRVLRQRRQGPAATTQRGIDSARGFYVAILDQDDVWLPSKLECAVNLLDIQPQIDLAFSGYQMIDEEGRPIGPAHIPPRVRFGFHDLFVDYQIGPTAATVIRLSAAIAAGRIDTSLHRYYDLEFFWRISRLRPDNVAATRAALTQYRRHTGQLSANIDEMRKEWERVVDAVEKRNSVDPRSVARAHSNMNRYFAFLEYENERFAAGWGELARSFRFAPVSFLLDRRNWLLAGGCFGGLILPRHVRLAAERFAGDAHLRIATDSKIR